MNEVFDLLLFYADLHALQSKKPQKSSEHTHIYTHTNTESQQRANEPSLHRAVAHESTGLFHLRGDKTQVKMEGNENGGQTPANRRNNQTKHD